MRFYLCLFLFGMVFLSGCTLSSYEKEQKMLDNQGQKQTANKEISENPVVEQEPQIQPEQFPKQVPPKQFPKTEPVDSQPSQQTKALEWKKGELAIKGKYADADIIDLGNGNYRMYYSEEPEVQGFEGRVYSATSSDGINWKEESGVRKTWAIFPSVIKLDNGKYRMYFQNAGLIKSALSSDGLNWQDEDGVRIDTSNSEGLEFVNVVAPTVLKIKDEYVMVYGGAIDEKYPEKVPNNEIHLLMWATSKDGVTFEKKGIALDSRRKPFFGWLDGPELVKWDDQLSRLYFWSYRGVYSIDFREGKFSQEEKFEFTTSSDPNMLFPPNPPGDPTVMKINNKWFMYYGVHTEGIAYATKEAEVLTPLPENLRDTRASFEILTEKEKELLPECKDIIFTVPPVPLDKISEIEPIGGTNPPEHTLASISSDTYIGVSGDAPLVAPGDMWIIFIQPRSGVTQDAEDHVIKYAMCKDVYGVVDHVKGFSSEMKKIVDNFECEDPSAKPGDSRCPITIFEKVKAGTPFGIVGGKQGNFNFGTWDLRVTHQYLRPELAGHLSLHSTCPYSYYPSDLKEKLLSKINREDSNKCGKVLYDVKGTLAGDWRIGDATPTKPSDWSKLLFLGYDNRFPDQIIISTSGVFVDKPTKLAIAPKDSGLVNRKFEQVSDNKIYCYEIAGNEAYAGYQKGVTEGRILIQLNGEDKLKIEHQQGSCSGSWIFENPTEYNR